MVRTMTSMAASSLVNDFRTRNRATVSVSGREVIDSGTILTSAQTGLKINLANLTYHIIFDDDAREQEISMDKTSEKSVQIRLSKFTNVLGTSVNFLPIGDVSGSGIWLSPVCGSNRRRYKNCFLYDLRRR